MEKTGRIMLTKQELSDFNSTGIVPSRIRESWGIETSEELRKHIGTGFTEVIDNESKTTGDTL